MTCAKRRVICVLSDDAGRTVSGENLCALPQPTCPREPGEGYAKCITICKQYEHAEIAALRTWSEVWVRSSHPTHALIRGHTHACSGCLKALIDAGVRRVDFGEEFVP